MQVFTCKMVEHVLIIHQAYFYISIKLFLNLSWIGKLPQVNLDFLYWREMCEQEGGQIGSQVLSFQHHQMIVLQHIVDGVPSIYFQLLNLSEEFFSACIWKVYDNQPHTRMTWMQHDDITADACWGCIRHSFFLIYLDIFVVMWMIICGPTDMMRCTKTGSPTAVHVQFSLKHVSCVYISTFVLCFLLCTMQCCLLLSVFQWHDQSTNDWTNSKSINVTLVQSLVIPWQMYCFCKYWGWCKKTKAIGKTCPLNFNFLKLIFLLLDHM